MNAPSPYSYTATTFGNGTIVPDATTATGWRFKFSIRDHLGNTRAVISDLNDDGVLDLESSTDPSELLSIHNYMPFGMEMVGPWMQSHPASMDYLYNSTEFNFRGSLGWYDYGARWYDPTIGRWNAACPVIFQQKIVGRCSMNHQGIMTVASDRTYDGMDPLADHPNQIHISTFAYAWNNPIMLIDPDGRCPDCGDNYFKLVAYPYRKIGGYISSIFNRNASGGLYITSHHATEGGEDNVRQGDGDNVRNLVDDSPHAMGYSLLYDNTGDDDLSGLGDLLDTGEDLVDIVTPPEAGLIAPADDRNKSDNDQMNQTIVTEIEPLNHGWIGKGPPPGESDTIVNPNGSRTIIHRSAKSGIRYTHTID